MARWITTTFRMDERTWQRHASPWSVWTRAVTLLLFTLAIWSRVWIGWWALVPLAALVVWTWLNPRLFPPPRSTDNWGSKATFGERVYLARHQVPIPEHHRRAAAILQAIATVGIIPWAVGLWQLDLTLTLLGVAIIYAGKMWFLDRMVWLYEDMKDRHPPYQAWVY